MNPLPIAVEPGGQCPISCGKFWSGFGRYLKEHYKCDRRHWNQLRHTFWDYIAAQLEFYVLVWTEACKLSICSLVWLSR